MRTLILLLLGLTNLVTSPLLAATPKRLTIADYFQKLPDQTFEAPPKDMLRYLRYPKSGVEDIANGYLSFTGDGAQPAFEVALFRFKDDRPLLAVCQGEHEGPDSRYLEFFALGTGDRLHPVKRSIFPIPNEKGYSFELPRHGRTVIVRDGQSGKVRGKFTWNGDRFVEEK